MLVRYIKLKQPLFRQLIRWDKPVGTLLLLWPTLTALWLANHGPPPLELLIIFSLGVVITRAAGCVINDIADRKLDGAVARTCQRPLATQALTLLEAVAFLIGLLVIALCLLLLLPLACVPVALVAVMLSGCYPWTKRFFPYPQLFLGLAFNTGVLMAYVALQNKLPISAWLLYVIAMLWTFVYDTWYAMVDQQDDEKIGIRSSAISLGRYAVPTNATIFLLIFLLFLGIGKINSLSLWFFIGVSLVGIQFAWQCRICKDQHPSHCFRAFNSNQWAWLLVFLSVVLSC